MDEKRTRISGVKKNVYIVESEFKGVEKLHIREYWFNENGEELPGKGVCIDRTELPALIKALQEV
jgi:hypothetical protein